MKYVVDINCVRSSFGCTTTEASNEVSRVLREIADAVDAGDIFTPIVDTNGTRVGSAGFVDNYDYC